MLRLLGVRLLSALNSTLSPRKSRQSNWTPPYLRRDAILPHPAAQQGGDSREYVLSQALPQVSTESIDQADHSQNQDQDSSEAGKIKQFQTDKQFVTDTPRTNDAQNY